MRHAPVTIAGKFTKLKGTMIHPIRGESVLTPNRDEDHMAKDCEKPLDVSTITCRNCHEMGHFRQDCTKKRDYSRIQCNNCGECKLLTLFPGY